MDSREYAYLERRTDTFPRSTLEYLRHVLIFSQSASAAFIERVLAHGYLEPPPGHPWHGCYQIKLETAEAISVFDDLKLAQTALLNNPSFPEADHNTLSQFISYWERFMSNQPEDYESYKEQQDYYDLRSAAIDQFLMFVFNHKVADRSADESPWYFADNIWIDYDKEHAARLCIQLFDESANLLTKFPKDQLEAGFWLLMGPNVECSAHELIFSSDLDIELKEQLITSMFHLYENFFSKEPLDSSSNMWWDSFAFGFQVPGRHDTENNSDDRRIQDAMCDTLTKILHLDSETCQGAALHGFGHLNHPRAEEIINDFIMRNPALTDGQIAYARAAMAGQIL